MSEKLDLVGQQFNRWTVLYYVGLNKWSNRLWHCRCVCGVEKDITTDRLTSGTSKSCGCLQKESAHKHKYIDLSGKQFDRLTVICDAGRGKQGSVLWYCVCSCGTKLVVDGISLREGRTRSCGCLNNELIQGRGLVDITGQKFGRLLVIGRDGSDSNGGALWKAQCDCGNTSRVGSYELRHGIVVSCGCYKNEKSAERSYIHGLSGTKEYRAAIAKRRQEMVLLHDTAWTPQMESFLRDMFPRCVVCGVTQKQHMEKFNESLHVDHVLPLYDSNGLKPGNATVLCRTCNTTKWRHKLEDLPDEWQHKILYSARAFEEAWNNHVESGILINEPLADMPNSSYEVEFEFEMENE